MTAPRKAKTPQGRQAKGGFNTTSSATILADLLESIKPVLLAGKSIRLIDYAIKRSPFAGCWAVVAWTCSALTSFW